MINNNFEHLTHPKYRADIDGLRAVAILPVVGFHAFPEVFKGGFIGVDIFFVISGFLISTIIIGSLERNSFSFVEFYSRRIRRIFPALLLMLITILAFGWFVLLADEYKQLGKHVVGSATFILNILLWRESGYFDNSAVTKPLLHLWSLGIEEQYYIIWPLLLWLAWKRRFNLLTITIVIALISFALNVSKVRSDAVASFYSPQTRFWELLAGSTLSYVTMHKKSMSHNFKHGLDAWLSRMVYQKLSVVTGKVSHDAQSVTGAALIFIGIFVITNEKNFPGWWAVLPTLGAVMIIAAGAQAWLNRVVLSNRVLVWFGLISFPLYLWHWPLLSLAHVVLSETPSLSIRIAIVLISIALAWLTYWLIEKPFRFGNHSRTKTITLLALMFVVGCAGYYCYSRDGLSSRYGPSFHEILPSVKTIDCSDLVKSTDSAHCTMTDAPNSPYVAVIGDSHAGHLLYGFSRSENSKFNKFIVINASGCQPTLGFETREGCDKQLTTAINLINKTASVGYVIMSGYSGIIESAGVETRNQIFDGYRRTINELKSSRKKIVFIIDNPTFKESAKRCEGKPLYIRTAYRVYPAFCYGAAEKDLQPRTEYNKFVERLRLENSDVVFYNPSKVLCSKDSCKLFDDTHLLYIDTDHLSKDGSQYVVNNLIDELVKLDSKKIIQYPQPANL